MKILAIGSLLVLFAVVAGVNATPSVFADHPTAEVQVGKGTSVPGCEETNVCYVPYEVTVDVGGEVTWINEDAAHTVTSGNLKKDANMVGLKDPNGFDSSLFMSGNTFSHKFNAPGEYPYFCTVHPWMTGIVHVVDKVRDDDHMDDHMDDHDDSMMEVPSSIDEIMVTISNVNEGAQASPLQIRVEITDLDGGMLEHVNFMVTAMQNGEVIFETEEHAHDGKATVSTPPLPLEASADNPVDVTVELLGFGVDKITGPSGQLATSQIVPEFGTIAVMVLGIAIVSIVALSAKSRVIPRM